VTAGNRGLPRSRPRSDNSVQLRSAQRNRRRNPGPTRRRSPLHRCSWPRRSNPRHRRTSRSPRGHRSAPRGTRGQHRPVATGPALGKRLRRNTARPSRRRTPQRRIPPAGWMAPSRRLPSHRSQSLHLPSRCPPSERDRRAGARTHLKKACRRHPSQCRAPGSLANAFAADETTCELAHGSPRRAENAAEARQNERRARLQGV
jgi:hypothetical protein